MPCASPLLVESPGQHVARGGAAGNNSGLGWASGRAIEGRGASEGDDASGFGVGGGGPVGGDSGRAARRRRGAGAQAGGLSQEGFEAYLPRLRAEAERAGIRAATLDRIFPTLDLLGPHRSSSTAPSPAARAGVPDQSAVRALSRPPAHPGADRPRPRPLRREPAPARTRSAGATACPPRYLIAIWGKETGYGTIMGNFDLLNSLASLAYEGRRRELFTAEFIATLRMVERGFPREELKGSWAGAAGHPQFLPIGLYPPRRRRRRRRPRRHLAQPSRRARLDRQLSAQRRLAAGPALGRRRCACPPASTAPPSPTACARRAAPPVFARHSRWLTGGEWRRLGIANSLPDSALASLIEPDGPGATAYLTTNNYRVILDYNCSNFYALTVALLADSVARINLQDNSQLMTRKPFYLLAFRRRRSPCPPAPPRRRSRRRRRPPT